MSNIFVSPPSKIENDTTVQILQKVPNLYCRVIFNFEGGGARIYATPFKIIIHVRCLICYCLLDGKSPGMPSSPIVLSEEFRRIFLKVLHPPGGSVVQSMP